VYLTATTLPPSPESKSPINTSSYVGIITDKKLDPSRQYPIRTAPRVSFPNTRPGQFFLPGPTSNIFVNPRNQGVLNSYIKMRYECYGGRSAPLYGLKQLNRYKGSGGNKKLPPRRFPTVGIVRKVPSTRTQLSHKHHHHGGDVWVDEERFGFVLYKTIK